MWTYSELNGYMLYRLSLKPSFMTLFRRSTFEFGAFGKKKNARDCPWLVNKKDNNFNEYLHESLSTDGGLVLIGSYEPGIAESIQS